MGHPPRTQSSKRASVLVAGVVVLAAASLHPAAAWALDDAGEYQLALPEFGPELGAQARPEHPGRALLLTAATLLGGTVWYWSDLDFNSRDWDLRWDWPSWKSKLTFSAVRFDQNLFQTNAVSHARAGWAQYMIARGNGMEMAGSVGATLASSAFWEYVIEFKEMPSLNDMVVNTTAGVALGEPFYQLGEFFQRSSPSLFSRGMAAAFSPVATTNDWIDGRRRPREAMGLFGFNSEIWHRFELGAGLANQTFNSDLNRGGSEIGLGSELVMLPGYTRPGTFTRWTKPGAFTTMTGRLTTDKYGISGGSLLTRTSIAGRHAQRYERDPEGGVSGQSGFFGLGSAFDYESFGRPDGQDYLAVMNIIGPIGELTARKAGLRLRVSGELYGDFAMVKSLAMGGRLPPMMGPIYRPGEHGGDMPSVLGARGYYYALGLTGGTRLVLDYWGWDVGAEVRGDHFTSIKGFDRFQDEIDDEVDLADRRLVGRAWIGMAPWGAGPRLSTGLAWRWRRGLADDVAAEHLDTQLAAALSLVF